MEIPNRGTIRLKDPDSRRRWYDGRETGIYAVFDQEGAEQAAMLSFFIGNFVPRGVLAAHIVEAALKNEGLDAALRKYRSLRTTLPPIAVLPKTASTCWPIGHSIGLDPGGDRPFELITTAYPHSSNAYGCLAEAYGRRGHGQGHRELQESPPNSTRPTRLPGRTSNN